MQAYDVVVLGAGPAGLSAALSAKQKGANTLIIEREEKPGGILKQCIHDGFGLIQFKERLTGPEYAARYVKLVKENQISMLFSTFVSEVKKHDHGFELTLVNSAQGVVKIMTTALILASGCRERTSKQIHIHGTRPAGVYTAGTAQYFVNIMGYLPCKRCVILGSGDIGLIMARRLTLEGAQVVGVYEAKSTPSGLTRNIVQCLDDYNIPLYLSHTITKIIGDDRVEAVEITKVDQALRPIAGTEQLIECDGVILSVGLIPENEIAESLGITIDPHTKGPFVDHCFMTSEPGIFSCGNALHVNDLVDYVSESGELAGGYAADYVKGSKSKDLIPFSYNDSKFLYVVPQYFNITSYDKKPVLYFRSNRTIQNVLVRVRYGTEIVLEKKYDHLTPPEMERLQLDLSMVLLHKQSCLEIDLLEVQE